MIVDIHPYPAYKPSAARWLGDVPEHWEVRQFRTFCAGFNNGTSAEQLAVGQSDYPVSRIETISNGLVDYSRVGYLSERSSASAHILQKNDILISHINSFAKVGNSARYDGHQRLFHGMNLIRVTPLERVVPLYLEYLLKSEMFIWNMQQACKPAINQVSVTTAAIKGIRLPLPPLDEQAAIVRYLDDADQRIRAYVSAKERLIALLEEQRQAIIQHAVTRGLDLNVQFKPSGVEWLGDVPEHWETRRLGDSVVSCINGTWGEEPNGIDDLPCIRVADFDRHLRRVSTERLTMRAVTPRERVRRLLNRGDLLLEKSGGGDNQPVGVVVLYDHNIEAVTSNFVGKLQVKNGYKPEYLSFLHATLYALGINKRSIKQTTGIQNIHVLSYLSEPVSFPPFIEQIDIVEELNKATADIDVAIDCAHRQINLIEEYRTRLIADVVTGKLDVRAASEQLPDPKNGHRPAEHQPLSSDPTIA